jgi:hypothetical protein
MRFLINSKPVEADFDPRTSLLDLLGDHLGLPGSKKGCNQGACAACLGGWRSYRECYLQCVWDVLTAAWPKAPPL